MTAQATSSDSTSSRQSRDVASKQTWRRGRRASSTSNSPRQGRGVASEQTHQTRIGPSNKGKLKVWGRECNSKKQTCARCPWRCSSGRRFCKRWTLSLVMFAKDDWTVAQLQKPVRSRRDRVNQADDDPQENWLGCCGSDTHDSSDEVIHTLTCRIGVIQRLQPRPNPRRTWRTSLQWEQMKSMRIVVRGTTWMSTLSFIRKFLVKGQRRRQIQVTLIQVWHRGPRRRRILEESWSSTSDPQSATAQCCSLLSRMSCRRKCTCTSRDWFCHMDCDGRLPVIAVHDDHISSQTTEQHINDTTLILDAFESHSHVGTSETSPRLLQCQSHQVFSRFLTITYWTKHGTHDGKKKKSEAERHLTKTCVITDKDIRNVNISDRNPLRADATWLQSWAKRVSVWRSPHETALRQNVTKTSMNNDGIIVVTRFRHYQTRCIIQIKSFCFRFKNDHMSLLNLSLQGFNTWNWWKDISKWEDMIYIYIYVILIIEEQTFDTCRELWLTAEKASLLIVSLLIRIDCICYDCDFLSSQSYNQFWLKLYQQSYYWTLDLICCELASSAGHTANQDPRVASSATTGDACCLPRRIRF